MVYDVMNIPYACPQKKCSGALFQRYGDTYRCKTCGHILMSNELADFYEYLGDVESGEEDWDAHGFVRHNNVLPQLFLVQLILSDADGNNTVLPLALDEDNQGELSVTLSGKHPAVLVVSGMTRYTTEVASYEITIN